MALKHYEQLEDVNSTVPWESSFLEILMHKKLLHNKSEEATIYLSCIFADLIRITIPLEQWLYESANDMRQMFLQVLRSLRRLGSEDDTFGFTRFYLLERLSVSKAFVLLTNDDMDGENIIDEVFVVFFELVQYVVVVVDVLFCIFLCFFCIFLYFFKMFCIQLLLYWIVVM